MASTLRDLLPVGLIILGVLWVQAEIRGAEARGESRIHEAAADSAEDRADRIGRANVVLADSVMALRDRYAVDSVRWSERAAESRARIATLTQRGQATADALRERLDSAGTALLATYEATVDSIIGSYEIRVADLEADRASLWSQRESLAELVEGLEAENVALRSTNASLRASLDAARRADSGILPDFGDLTKPVYAAIGAAIGYGLGRVGR